jgi:hypothetical protein
VNLVTDGPPATALAFNPRDKRAMTKPPRSKNEPLLTRWLIIRYLVTGLCVSCATIGIFVKWYLDRGVTFGELMNWGACLAVSCQLFTHERDVSLLSFIHLFEQDGQHSDKCHLFTQPQLSTPQTMTLSVLVVAELAKALSAVSLDQRYTTNSIVEHPCEVFGTSLTVLFGVLQHVCRAAVAEPLANFERAVPVLAAPNGVAVGSCSEGVPADAAVRARVEGSRCVRCPHHRGGGDIEGCGQVGCCAAIACSATRSAPKPAANDAKNAACDILMMITCARSGRPKDSLQIQTVET